MVVMQSGSLRSLFRKSEISEADVIKANFQTVLLIMMCFYRYNPTQPFQLTS